MALAEIEDARALASAHKHRPGGLLPKPIADLVEAGREAVLSEEPEEEE